MCIRLLCHTLLLLAVSLHAHAQSAWTISRTNLPEVTGAAAIAYGNGRFVVTLAGGNNAPAAAWSTDGNTWNSSQLRFPQSGSLVFVGGSFYLAGDGGVFRSTDGEIWQRIYQPTGTRPFNHIATDGRALLVGYSYGSSLPLHYSADRVNFRETAPLPESGPPNQSATLDALASVNGRFFAKTFVILPNGNGREYIASTLDGGQTWLPATDISGSSYLAGSGSRLVAYGPPLRTTSDGVTFTSAQPLTLPSGGSISIGGSLAYAGGRFFFLGSFYSSTNGTTWAPYGTAPAVVANRQMRSIAYGNGRFIATGYDNSGPPAFAQLDILATLVAEAPPVLATVPTDRTVSEGSSTTFGATVEANPPGLTYQWRRAGVALAGATNSTFTIAAVTPADAGLYTVDVRNSLGTTASDAALLTITPRIVAPTISLAPTGVAVSAGAGFTLSVTAAGTGPLSYQWFQDGNPLRGATLPTLSFVNSPPSAAGAYFVRIANLAGSVVSVPVTVTVTPISRISNLSVLTSLSSPTDSFTLGYVVGGANTTGSKPLLLRAAGPALGALGVGGTLDDPRLELFAGSTKTNENDNWGNFFTGANALASAFSAVGAFPFSSPTSRDAAVTTSLTTRDNSVKISATDAGTGLVIAEIYDATPSGSFTTATPRLLNVSVLKSLGTGLTVGFTIAGSAPKTVLIRAIGPTLGDFGVPGTVADPQLALFNAASVKLAENDNWAATPALATSLTAAFTSVGAFTLPPTSKDAALLTTLQPGGYSVQVSGVNNTTGTALVEVYEVP